MRRCCWPVRAPGCRPTAPTAAATCTLSLPKRALSAASFCINSVFNSLATVDDLGVLQQALGALRQLQGLGLAQELLDLVERLERQPGGGERIICQFEQVPAYSGSKWLAMLYNVTQHRRPIVLTYQPFQAARPVERAVHPQLLKQYNGKWFLVALREDAKLQMSVFALDRIKCIDEAAGVTFVAAEHEPATMFENLIGGIGEVVQSRWTV